MTDSRVLLNLFLLISDILWIWSIAAPSSPEPNPDATSNTRPKSWEALMTGCRIFAGD